VGELARVSESSDFKAVVVVFPQFTDRTFTAYRHNEDHAYIRSTAEAQDLRVFDLLPAFTTCRKEVKGSLHRDNLHPNKRGHTCAADAIAKYILEMLGPEA
jgi:lysophospholipase L1-like esterase